MMDLARLRPRLRRTAMALATAAGRPRGFFSPYRHAHKVAPPGVYGALEREFARARPSIRAVLDRIAAHRARLAEFEGPPPEPRWAQSWFPRLDGAAAYALVRAAAPRRIVEVGSGHSTRMLARAAADAGGGAEILCFDPEPRADISALPVTLERRVLAAEDLAVFETLEAGDMAVFDGSHLLWPGSDADIALNRVMPVLAAGVLVHLHDVFLPDPYPEAWAWRGYTEQLGLGGWLVGGGARVVFASHYAATRMPDEVAAAVGAIPLPSGAWETSLWLERR